MEQRSCSRCARELPLTDFARDASKAPGHKSICKACDRARAKRFYRANRERILAAANARNSQARGGPRLCKNCDAPAISSKHLYCANCQAMAQEQRRTRKYVAKTSLVVCDVCGDEYRKQVREVKCRDSNCCPSPACRRWLNRTRTSSLLRWIACTTCRRMWLLHGNSSKMRCEFCHQAAVRAPCKGPVCRLHRSRTPQRQQPRQWIACRCGHCDAAFLDFKGQHPNSYALCPDCKPRRRYREDKERAERAGVAYEPIDRRRIFERDEYRCGLCGELTDRSARSSTPRFPTLDHIIPISRGGGHVEGNVQTACFECNWRKGDQGGGGGLAGGVLAAEAIGPTRREKKPLAGVACPDGAL